MLYIKINLIPILMFRIKQFWDYSDGFNINQGYSKKLFIFGTRVHVTKE